MMRSATVFLALVAALSATSVVAQKLPPYQCWQANSAMEARIKSAVGEELKDPYSAVYSRPMFFGKSNTDKSEHACGFVNAKNSYGAYGGKDSFFVTWSEEPRYVLVQFGELALSRCKFYRIICDAHKK
ncbi:MAG: hypothetical protein GXY45_11735 [Ramlibacter sp.]|nr:hypothetical protein [Ramlibacter sp.]